MNATHIHLAITHLPIFGVLLGTFILIWGMWRKSADIKNVSYGIYIISAIGAGIAYATGEGAEDGVEGLPGVLGDLISRHEDFAQFALISMIALGIVALAAMFLSKRVNAISRVSATVVLLVALLSFGLIGRTGQLGGQIRHTEVQNGISQNVDVQQNAGAEEDDD